jgi:hypothetical protein
VNVVVVINLNSVVNCLLNHLADQAKKRKEKKSKAKNREKKKSTMESNAAGRRNNNNNRGPRKRNANNNKRNKNSVPGGGGGGGGGGHLGGPRKPSVPPPPQTKLVLRNIGNPEKYGTVKDILQHLIQSLVESCNQNDVLNGAQMELDPAATRYLIQEEELAKKYHLAEQAKREAEKAEARKPKVEEEGDCDAKEEGDEEGDKEEEPNEEEQGQEDVEQPLAGEKQEEPKQPKVVVQEPTLEVIVAPTRPSSVPVIIARPLYIVPPKKTHRRGERAGVAYVLLTAPKIEKIEVPEPVIVHVKVPEPVKEEGETLKVEEAKEEVKAAGVSKDTAAEESPTEETGPDLEANPAESTTDPTTEATPELVSETTTHAPIREGEKGSESAPTPTPTEVAPVAAPAPPLAPVVDYSRAVAQGRLLLQRAVDQLTLITDEDAKSPQQEQQVYAQCMVEASMSGKTWRLQYNRPDRREGTLEATADYKNWQQSLTQQKEELKSRPKPAPGGGTISLSGDTVENGQPMAALVQHLRAKRQELKRKKGKKKKPDSGKDGNTTNKGGKHGKKKPAASGDAAANKGGGRSAAGAAGKKKKKKPKKKNAVAPTALLKPTAGTVVR